ncbi:MAG: hypothetical protein RL131_1429 [Bacteroidota bacterium]
MNMGKRLVLGWILFFYVALLINILVFKNIPALHMGQVTLKFGGTQSGTPNYVPFKTILPYLAGERGALIAVINVIGNIVLLMPVGFLIPFFSRNMNLLKMVGLAILFCGSIEAIQAFMKIGIFDIDDVILNGSGMVLGYGCFSIYPMVWNYFKTRKMILLVCIGVFTAVLFYAAFKFLYWGPSDDMRPDRLLRNNKVSSVTDENVKLSSDLCNGTGGTGEIISIEGAAFTIRKRDGSKEEIKLSESTEIKNSKGRVASSVLKPGIHVTVVTSNSEEMIAAVVIICGS